MLSFRKNGRSTLSLPFLFLLLFPLLIPALFTACGTSDMPERELIQWQESAHTLRAEWSVDAQRYEGLLSLDGQEEGKPRRLTVSFTAPDAMRGITLVREGNLVTLTLDGLVRTGGEEYAPLFSVFRFFEEQGHSYAEQIGENGERILSFRDAGGQYTVRIPAGGEGPDLLTYTSEELQLSLQILQEESNT